MKRQKSEEEPKIKVLKWLGFLIEDYTVQMQFGDDGVWQAVPGASPDHAKVEEARERRLFP